MAGWRQKTLVCIMIDKVYNHIFQYCPVGIVEMDATARVTHANFRAKEIFSTSSKEASLGADSDASEDCLDAIARIFNPENPFILAVVKTRSAVFDIRHTLMKTDGTMAIISVNVGPVPDRKGQLKRIIAIIEDITDQQMGEQDREKLIQELSNQSRQLEELHGVLKILIALREKEITDLEEKTVFNLKSLVIPYMEKLSRSRLSDDSRIYLDIALSNLLDIFSSFGSTLTSKTFSFTPRELEVADMVRQGKSSKEIAAILHLSVRSVESHRRWIRRKLGLQGKSVNLRAFLLSLK